MSQEAMKLPPYLNASYEGDDLFTGDQVRELLANHCEDNLNMVKQEQGEPVAWMCQKDNGHFDVLTDQTCKKCFPVYTTPQQRKPLTDEQYFEIGQRHWLPSVKVEQIHKEIFAAESGIKE